MEWGNPKGKASRTQPVLKLLTERTQRAQNNTVAKYWPRKQNVGSSSASFTYYVLNFIHLICIKSTKDNSCLACNSGEGDGTPTPVLLPGKSHGWRSLVGCSPWDRRVWHCWATSLSLFTFMHWRRKWQPTPVFLPGGSQGWWSLVGCHLWGHIPAPNSVLWKGAKPRNLMYSEAWASLVAQMVKNLPAVWEAWVQSLGWEDALEKGKATHSSILAWRIPWTI